MIPAIPRGAQLRIACCNLHFGGISRDGDESGWQASMSTLRGWDPDVVLVQEMAAPPGLIAGLQTHPWRTANELGMTPLLGPPGPLSVTGNHPAVLVATGGGLKILRKTMHVDVQVKLGQGYMYFAPLKNSKSTKSRDVPVADPVIPVLAEHVREYPPVPVTLPWGAPDGKPVTRELLFTGADSRALNRNTFNRDWRKAWKGAGVPDRGPRLNGCHVLRHTAASVWLSAGLSLAKVAAFLGDTQEVVLNTYSHFMPDDDDRAREIMNAFFLSDSGEADTRSCATVVQ